MRSQASLPDSTAPRQAVVMIGFGEAAMALVDGWRQNAMPWRNDIRSYDIKTKASPDLSDGKWADFKARHVKGEESLSQALEGASIIFSLVTADQALAATSDAAAFMETGQIYFDCNSCASTTKIASRKLIEEAGGYYVDCAIMAPIHPHRHHTPMLLSI